MEGLDVFHRHRHRLLQLIAEALAGGGDLRLAHLQRGDGGFIKLRAVFAQRRVAVGFDVIQISVTVLLMLSEAEIAGRVKSCCCWSALQPFQSMIVLKLMIVFPCVSRDRLADYSIIFSIGSTRMSWRPAPSVFPWSPRTGFRC